MSAPRCLIHGDDCDWGKGNHSLAPQTATFASFSDPLPTNPLLSRVLREAVRLERERIEMELAALGESDARVLAVMGDLIDVVRNVA